MNEPLELELDLVSDGQGGYRVTVRSAAAEESGRLAVDPWPVLRMRRELQTTLLASAVTPRSAVSEVEAPVREVGRSFLREGGATGLGVGLLGVSLVLLGKRGAGA